MEKQQAYLKANRTRSELRFAEMLTEWGVYFKEQEMILTYFPDFYFPMNNHRIIELDGKCHAVQKKHDAKKDAKLRAAGYSVMRIPSREVFNNAEWLMHRVLMFLRIDHEPVSRKVRKRIRKRKPKTERKTPAWAKVPKLTKDHLTRAKDWKPTRSIVEKVEQTICKPREITVIKRGSI